MIRPLAHGEAALAREVFGRDLRLDDIRLLGSPWPFDRAFVPGRWFGRDWIVWPKATLAPDLSQAPLRTQAVFVHELVHVWQAQNGVNLLTGKLKAGDGPGAYAYPVDERCEWIGLNIEQQAMVVEHRFLQSRGARVPADPAFYQRICPIGMADF
ncbi:MULTISPECIES: hypothetical protein [Brevundimonas]|uniref:hypothetical protein n=1 Tax=Brevundimonas TaxID=41275 RepID=UPI002579A390|nr:MULTISPECIES: hypothetical protein [Brevundimonas]